jgi:hypothetical protein
MKLIVDKALQSANSGNLSRQELENLRKNALRMDGAEQVVEACDRMLSMYHESKSGSTREISSVIAETRNGYNIMCSAFTESGVLIKPELTLVADELVNHQFVRDIAVFKTQLKLSFKGHPFTAGCNTKCTLYWLAIPDDNKISGSTIEPWSKLGEIKKGTYFNTKYIAAEVAELDKLHAVLDCVVFT